VKYITLEDERSDYTWAASPEEGPVQQQLLNAGIRLAKIIDENF